MPLLSAPPLGAPIPTGIAEGAAYCEVVIRQAAQIKTQRPEHQRVLVADPKPGADANASGWLDQEGEGKWAKARAHLVGR